MKVTIAVLYTDKDQLYAKTFFDNVNLPENVNMLFIDNCETKSVFYYEKKQTSYIHFENIPVQVARKKSLEYCSGDYVWFIDADDMFYNVDYIAQLETVADCISFDYESYEKIGTNLIHKEETGLHAFKCGGLWNKLFRKEALQKIYEQFPDSPYQTFEDSIVISLFQIFNFSVEIIPYRVYRYNQYRSRAGKDPKVYYHDIKDVFEFVDQNIKLDPESKSKLLTTLFYHCWNATEYFADNYYNGDFSQFDFLHSVTNREYIENIRTKFRMRLWLLENGSFELEDNKYNLRYSN